MHTGQNTTKAADSVVRALEEQIRSGVLDAGKPLPSEREMMEQFAISRTVAREAVLTLTQKGWLEAKPRFRPIVRKPDFNSAIDAVSSIITHLVGQEDGVKNLFDTRIMIEAMLVREAAKHAQKVDLLALEEALADNAAAIDDSALFFQTDMIFHGLLYDIPRNPALPAIHKAYMTWLSPQWKQMPRETGRNRRNVTAHQKIFTAIATSDPDAAEAALRDHLAAAWQQVRATFGYGD